MVEVMGGKREERTLSLGRLEVKNFPKQVANHDSTPTRNPIEQSEIIAGYRVDLREKLREKSEKRALFNRTRVYQTLRRLITLHMYMGITRLSFCEEAASNREERRTARKYRPSYELTLSQKSVLALLSIYTGRGKSSPTHRERGYKTN